LSNKKDKFEDPSEMMAKAMTDVVENVFKKKSNGRPHCPSCGAKLWKRDKGYGEFSCPNSDCPEGVVDVVELGKDEVKEEFENGLQKVFK